LISFANSDCDGKMTGVEVGWGYCPENIFDLTEIGLRLMNLKINISPWKTNN